MGFELLEVLVKKEGNRMFIIVVLSRFDIFLLDDSQDKFCKLVSYKVFDACSFSVVIALYLC